MIGAFSGKWKGLSNFEPCEIVWEGLRFPTTEHAFQAAKTLDMDERHVIRLMKSPGQAKRAGRVVTLRPNWEEIKIPTMEQIVRLKFIQPEFKELLLSTGEQELQEGNWWGDTFWGVSIQTGRGRNELGKILMRLRESLES
jgi:ribA/ribD-fused uncharacterized protein